MSSPAATSPYAGHRFPAEVISHAVWPYFRFPLGLRMVEEMLAARGIVVSHETVRQAPSTCRPKIAKSGMLAALRGSRDTGDLGPKLEDPGPCGSEPGRKLKPLIRLHSRSRSDSQTSVCQPSVAPEDPIWRADQVGESQTGPHGRLLFW